MARMMSIPSVAGAGYEYDPAPSQQGLLGLAGFASSMAGNAQRQKRETDLDRLNQRDLAMRSVLQDSEREASQLRDRATVFDLRNQLAEATRVQLAKEADFALQPLLSDLTAYAGSENWAGIFAKRRQIIEDPRFAQSDMVRQMVSELDQGLKNYGSEYTTDGREVTFHDIIRMAGSTDAAEQKEAYRILALRSESSDSFIDSLPEDYIGSRDPMFKLQLKSFIRDNPRVHREDYQRYKEMETEYINSIKQQFASDPVLVAKMTSSTEVQNALKDMRSSMLYGRTGSQTDWMPKVSATDLAVRDEDLVQLKEAMSVRIGDSYDTFTMSLGRGIADFFTGDDSEALEKVARNPRLASMQGAGFLPAGMSDAETESWIKNNLGVSAWAGIQTIQLSKKIPVSAAARQFFESYGKKIAGRLLPSGAPQLAATVEAGRAMSAATTTGVNFGALGRSAIARAGLGVVGGTVGLGAIGLGVGINYIQAQNKINRSRQDSDFLLSDVINTRKEVIGMLSAGTPDPNVIYPKLDRLMNSIDRFNMLAAETGAGYFLGLETLFGQRQWQAIRARLAAAPGGMQQMQQRGMMERPGFNNSPMYGTEGITSSGLLPGVGGGRVSPMSSPVSSGMAAPAAAPVAGGVFTRPSGS